MSVALCLLAVSQTLLAVPHFSVPGGVYTNASLDIELTGDFPGSVLVFTLNGSEPTATSPQYSRPIHLTGATIIRAKEYPLGQPGSPTVSQAYTFLGSDVLKFSSNLPLVIINTFGRSVPDGSVIPVAVRFVDVTGGRCSLLDVANFDGRGGLGVRGNSSAAFPKQPYKLELWDQSTNDFKASLLGLPAESDWVLYPPYSDKTLMRNVLAYGWHGQMGHYAVRTRFLELFVDVFGGRLTMSDYKGVYVLVEKIKRNKHRVDIQKLEPTDLTEPNITGGYIIKKDKLDPGEQSFTTPHGVQLSYDEPDQNQLVPTQKSWLKQWFTNFEATLYGPNFKDPTNGYAKYIDVLSFIDQQWIVEVTKNVDGYVFSNYMHKDRQGKLNMDPIWDFDLALGNADYGFSYLTNGWHWANYDDTNYPWFRRLFQDPDFNQRYIDRWGELRRSVFNTTNVLDRIDELAFFLNEAQARNFKQWPVLGTYVWPNAYVGSSYPSEVAWMKRWITGRLGWIEGNFLKAPAANQAGGPIRPGFRLTLQAPVGTILYTLDGTDPRLPGGGINPNAQVYSDAITLLSDAQLFARARQTNAWSPPLLATFDATHVPLVVTELMYHPPAPLAGSAYTAEDFEFIELLNIGAEPLDLNGIRFTTGITFDFAGSAVTNLAPGERVLVARNLAAFAERYGTGLKVAGQYAGSLSNAGEQLVLTAASGASILDFAYDPLWYPATDGGGSSLVIIDPNSARTNWSSPSAWQPSHAYGGVPGGNDAVESYQVWKARCFTPAQLTQLAVSGDTADPDQDGLNNRQEYLSGTDPWDATSCLKLEFSFSATSAGRLRFEAQPGNAYSIQYRDSLASGAWNKLTDIFARTARQTMEISDPAPLEHDCRYYRLVVLP